MGQCSYSYQPNTVQYVIYGDVGALCIVIESDYMEAANNCIMKINVCKFYLENKCRFGDKCKNRRERESVQTVAEKKTNTDENKCDKVKKKQPMKTAQDVINRL
jgi:hypothetical protein